jgi:hypothetical protein
MNEIEIGLRYKRGMAITYEGRIKVPDGSTADYLLQITQGTRVREWWNGPGLQIERDQKLEAGVTYDVLNAYPTPPPPKEFPPSLTDRVVISIKMMPQEEQQG